MARQQRTISVGIMTDKNIDVIQPGPHSTADNPTFVIKNVLIGINFHWQRREDQEFEGTLEILRHDDGTQTAINKIGVEDYLTSVISSEMNATAHPELLKAHAVISRSWLLKPIINKNSQPTLHQDFKCDETHRILWYERDAHTHFDVCADDHCQRYEGITRRDQHPQATHNVRQAIEQTWGQVLVTENSTPQRPEICDARFSKCCGGITERFENVWADEHYDYLDAVRDAANNTLPDLTNESNAQQWINSLPDAFCNTNDQQILTQVLNNYDQETQHFYRWHVRYSQDELTELVRTRTGIDCGEITQLKPLKRGPSGRIYELQIVGTKRTLIIGKELEIRRCLSKTHLYSSAFTVERDANGDFLLHGAGWGHGVGLCQIGAAVMAIKGYSYQQILAHYFPHSKLMTVE